VGEAAQEGAGEVDAVPEDAQEGEVLGEVAAGSEVADPDLDLEKLQRVWPAVLDQLSTAAPALAAFFEDARPVGFDAAESVVEISFPAAATFNKRKAEVPEQRERVAEALQTVTGVALKPTYVLLDGDAPAPEPAANREQPAAREMAKKSCWSG
jgi:hypothetical protein